MLSDFRLVMLRQSLDMCVCVCVCARGGGGRAILILTVRAPFFSH